LKESSDGETLMAVGIVPDLGSSRGESTAVNQHVKKTSYDCWSTGINVHRE